MRPLDVLLPGLQPFHVLQKAGYIHRFLHLQEHGKQGSPGEPRLNLETEFQLKSPRFPKLQSDPRLAQFPEHLLSLELLLVPLVLGVLEDPRSLQRLHMQLTRVSLEQLKPLLI